MKIGLIAEGRSDLAVLKNILKGCLNIDSSDILALVPEFNLDETDLAIMDKDQYSNWSIVKKSCLDKTKINDFLHSFDESRIIVIQIDSAERTLAGYDVTEPHKNKMDIIENSKTVRNNIVKRIQQWLDNENLDKMFYAVCIEEIEAWVLTLYSDEKETAKFNDPKKELDRILNSSLKPNQKNILKEKAYPKYLKLSSDFKKKKELNKCVEKNISLKEFIDSLTKVL